MNGNLHYSMMDWQPIEEEYFCACGCGEKVVWAGIGRKPKYFNDAHRKRQKRRKTSVN